MYIPIIETERLYLREMTQNDFSSLCSILQDKETMYAYEHAFSNDEVQKWLDNQIKRYREDGFGLWAVILKKNGDFIGQCGLTIQNVDEYERIEIGYLFRRDCWHNGYAIESAKACKKYAFEKLGINEVCSIIRDTNISSQRVAERNGMKKLKMVVKHYYGMDMPHIIFSVRKESEKND